MYSTYTYEGCAYVIQSVHVTVHVHMRDVYVLMLIQSVHVQYM